MSGQGEAPGRPRKLNLLRFEVGGACFAVESSQIAALLPFPGSAGSSASWFHQALEYAEAPTYRAPVLAVVPVEEGPPRQLVMDALDELLDVGLDEIHPFPPLIEPFALRKGLWGVLSRGSQTVLLVDLRRMLAPACPEDAVSESESESESEPASRSLP